MNNTTFETIQQIDQSLSTSKAIYDSSEAIIYIVVVILWYSSGILLLLRMQMIRSAEVVEHPSKNPTTLLHNHDPREDKQILKELADKKRRDKLWDIYFNRSPNVDNNKVTRQEPCRIRQIQRRLATIDREDEDYNERVQFLNAHSTSDLKSHGMNRHKSLIENTINDRLHIWTDHRSFPVCRKSVDDNANSDDQSLQSIRHLVVRPQFDNQNSQ